MVAWASSHAWWSSTKSGRLLQSAEERRRQTVVINYLFVMLAVETPVLGKEWNIFTYNKSYKRKKRISYKDFFIYLKQKQPPNK